jgi:hypothetical protein
MRWICALRQLVAALQVSCSACMAALTLKGSLAAAKLCGIVCLVTATLDGCATLLLHGPPTDGISRERQQEMLRLLLVRPRLDYGTCLVLSCSSSVSLARRLGHDSLVDLLEAGPGSPAAFIRYAAAFVRHAVTADGGLQATDKDITGSTLCFVQLLRPHHMRPCSTATHCCLPQILIISNS